MPTDAYARLAGARLLAVDPGARYLGLAVRTCRLRGARPYGVVERQPAGGLHRPVGSAWNRSLGTRSGSCAKWELRQLPDFGGVRSLHGSQADALAAVLATERIAAVVCGMPYHADGSRSSECDVVERAFEELQAEWADPVPVLFWDESWSTRRAVGPKRNRRRASSHPAAAAIVLSEVLEALAPLEADAGPLDELLESVAAVPGR
jgi:RNase H-fold protein (predicted Holliday junction resolvase)